MLAGRAAHGKRADPRATSAWDPLTDSSTTSADAASQLLDQKLDVNLGGRQLVDQHGLRLAFLAAAAIILCSVRISALSSFSSTTHHLRITIRQGRYMSPSAGTFGTSQGSNEIAGEKGTQHSRCVATSSPHCV